jgi:hypothetical protein
MKQQSLRNRFEDELFDQIINLTRSINEFENNIQKMNFDYSKADNRYLTCLWKYSNEICDYFQYCNGSVGNDRTMIRYVLFDLLLYLHIVQDRELTKEEQGAYSGLSGQQFRRHPDFKPEHPDTCRVI